MAYQTGVSTNTQDLLHRFASFLIDCGWNVPFSALENNYWRTHIQLNSGIYINLCGHIGNPFNNSYSTTQNCISGNISTGFDAAQGPQNQPGSAYESLIRHTNSWAYSKGLPAGQVVAYHFFAWENPKGACIVVETTPGNFAWLFFGHIEKSCDYPGTGAYLNLQYSQYPDSYSRQAPWGRASFYGVGFFHLPESFSVTLPGNGDDTSYTSQRKGDFISEGYGPQCAIVSSQESYTHRTLNFDYIATRGYNTLAGAPLLMPFYLWFVSWGNPYKYYSPNYMGYDTHKYYCTMQNVSPGTILSYGSKKYMLFPFNKVGDKGWALEYQ